jgi:hypothetical protein
MVNISKIVRKDLDCKHCLHLHHIDVRDVRNSSSPPYSLNIDLSGFFKHIISPQARFDGADIERMSQQLPLCLPVRVLSLQAARVLLVTDIIGVERRFVAGKSNGALLLGSHAARVEQARPKEDPNHCQLHHHVQDF